MDIIDQSIKDEQDALRQVQSSAISPDVSNTSQAASSLSFPLNHAKENLPTVKIESMTSLLDGDGIGADYTGTSIESKGSNQGVDVDVEEAESYVISAESRGDEAILEGATISFGENDATDAQAQSSDEEDDGIVVHISRPIASKRFTSPKFTDRGQRSYVRPQVKDAKAYEVEEATKRKEDDEIKNLRFSHQRTAFDIDIDAMESHPWRKKNVNISDYFNYGFDEDSWRVYCEKQLRIRSSKGLGPFNANAVQSRPAIMNPSIPAARPTMSAPEARNSSTTQDDKPFHPNLPYPARTGHIPPTSNIPIHAAPKPPPPAPSMAPQAFHPEMRGYNSMQPYPPMPQGFPGGQSFHGFYPNQSIPMPPPMPPQMSHQSMAKISANVPPPDNRDFKRENEKDTKRARTDSRDRDRDRDRDYDRKKRDGGYKPRADSRDRDHRDNDRKRDTDRRDRRSRSRDKRR